MTPVRKAPRDVVRYSTMSRNPAHVLYRELQSRRFSPVAMPMLSKMHRTRNPAKELWYCHSPHSWPFTRKWYCRLPAYRGVK
jgi:hypothetical protein